MRFSVLLFSWLVILGRPASAESPTSTHPRTAAMAGVGVAGPAGPSSVVHNPASLAELDRYAIALSTQAATSRLWSAQTDRPRKRFQQGLVGVGLTTAVRVPGPPLFRRFRLGVDLHTPPDRFIRLEAPRRADVPTWPMYGQRLEHLRAVAVAGLELTDRVAVGGGLSISPVLVADTYVHYEAGRGETPQENVVVNADRSLELGSAAVLGFLIIPHRWFRLGVVYRQARGGSIVGETEVSAGSVLIEDDLDFHQTWRPAELAFGARVDAVDDLAASADAEWARWSTYRTIGNERPEPGFRDVVNMRLGVEWDASDFLQLRGGYGFEPTPVPAQTADSNLLDANRHVVALGSGVDLGALDSVGLRIDFHVRAHLLQRRSWVKEDARLTDADPDSPGKQIDNVGYPGTEVGGQFWQTGLAVTFGGGPDE